MFGSYFTNAYLCHVLSSLWKQKQRFTGGARILQAQIHKTGNHANAPTPAIQRMAVAQIPVEEYSKFNNYSVEGLEKKAKRQATSRGNKAIGALFRKATAFPFPYMPCCERAYFYGR